SGDLVARRPVDEVEDRPGNRSAGQLPQLGDVSATLQARCVPAAPRAFRKPTRVAGDLRREQFHELIHVW
ncbi:MAG: hypothetical protein QOI10_4482, partial [Solirubrobacterales bacterium]|nr:hypothetical protein [Solirubrobacterales bacterium]